MERDFGGMRFRNLQAFNLSILGKQGWKFISNQDAIVSKVFKAKYFSSVDFLEVPLGHNPSFVWHSIHASHVKINEDTRWELEMEKKCGTNHGWNQRTTTL